MNMSSYTNLLWKKMAHSINHKIFFVTSKIILLLSTSWLISSCINNSNENPQQGTISQSETGELIFYINNKGFIDNPNIDATSLLVAYIYKKNGDFSQPCPPPSLGHKSNCLDSIAFANEPGFFGYNSSTHSYTPPLMSDESNVHPIKYLDFTLSQFIMQAYVVDDEGFPQQKFYQYTKFTDPSHQIKDGDEFDIYLAVHFNAINFGNDDNQRIKLSSSIFHRPIVPDLLSPKISIKVNLSANNLSGANGNRYVIPQLNTWYDPYVNCRGAAINPNLTLNEKSINVNTLVLSEINWAGSRPSNGSNFYNDDEFIELYNTSMQEYFLSGWSIRISQNNGDTTTVPFPQCTSIASNSVLTIAKHNDLAFTGVNIIDQNLSLDNAGALIELLDQSGDLVHTIDCRGIIGQVNWPGGSPTSPVSSMVLKNTFTGTPICNTTYYETTPSTLGGTAMSNMNIDFRYSTTLFNGTLASPGFFP